MGRVAIKHLIHLLDLLIHLLNLLIRLLNYRESSVITTNSTVFIDNSLFSTFLSGAIFKSFCILLDKILSWYCLIERVKNLILI